MKKAIPRQALGGLLLLLLLLSGADVAMAQAPETEEVFVYGVNASVPGAVYGTFAPPSVAEIYLLANRVSILSPRMTAVYYWPITNEYRAAWSQLNEPVAGVLEIMQGGRVIETLEQELYTIHFSSGPGTARPQLYVGEEAVVANEQFLASQTAYQQAAQAYQQAREDWLAAGREAQAQGLESADLGPAPEPPPPFDLFSTGLNHGFAIDLPVGDYQIRTRQPDGTIAAGSDRDLIIFDARRTSVGYEIIPEARWTFPEQADDQSDLILGAPDSVIYLRPRVAREYPALAYERLQDPQYFGDAAGVEWSWIGDETDETLDEGILEIVSNGEVVERLQKQSFSVKQVPGGDYGYEILVFDPDNTSVTPRADFSGYRLDLAAKENVFQVQLRSLSDELFVGSNREVRISPEVSLPSLLLLALIPLILGGAFVIWRRRRTRLTRQES